MARILVVDDEASIQKAVEKFFSSKGHVVVCAGDGEDAVRIAEHEGFDAAVVDLVMPKMDGMELIERLHRMDPSLAIIVMTGYATITSAVDAIKKGAYHYLTKPFELNDLAAVLDRAIEHHMLREENALLKEQLRERYRFENMIGKSEEINSVFKLIERVSPTDSTVLILGESGTGKELVAKALHCNSKRHDKPLVIVNCAAIPEQLLESELFGHVRGAFTGAIQTRPGRFDAANGGTIFLDEIGDMSPKLQVKLLRVLQEQTFEPVGSNISHKVNVRVIAATNQDLETAVKNRRFREDLYYRLNVIPIHIPPLRKRKSDIPLLVQHFVNAYGHDQNRSVEGVDADAMRCLMEYAWPGNVRELENAIEHAVVLRTSGLITIRDLPSTIALKYTELLSKKGRDSSDATHGSFCPLKESVEGYEKKIIEDALKSCGWNRNEAAKKLNINRTTLLEKMKRMKIEK